MPVHAHHEWGKALTFRDRFVILVAGTFASLTCLLFLATVSWYWLRTGLLGRDPYPYFVFTLAMTLLSVVQNVFISMGQNISERAARAQREADYRSRLEVLERLSEIARSVGGDYRG